MKDLRGIGVGVGIEILDAEVGVQNARLEIDPAVRQSTGAVAGIVTKGPAAAGGTIGTEAGTETDGGARVVIGLKGGGAEIGTLEAGAEIVMDGTGVGAAEM